MTQVVEKGKLGVNDLATGYCKEKNRSFEHEDEKKVEIENFYR